MDIANLIHRLTESGLTQTEIGKAIGCGQSSISEMAAGKIGRVRPSHQVVEGLKTLAEERGLRAEQKPTTQRRRKADRKQS